MLCFLFTLSYVKVLVGVLPFLKRCAIVSKSMCLFVAYIRHEEEEYEVDSDGLDSYTVCGLEESEDESWTV